MATTAQVPSRILYRTIAVLVLSMAILAPAQQRFVNYESAPVHPIRVSESGLRLYVLNIPDARLAVFSLADPDRPVLLKEIPVGLEPVSVTPRTADEVWVANTLSDTVSVVSISKGRVIGTIRVKDEPCDVVFAGTPQRAFVSLTASDEVAVFDAESHAPLGRIPVFGKDPRALAVSRDGKRVFALIHRSGNRTTIIPPEIAPPPSKPTNEKLPPAPPQGLIVSLDDPKVAKLTKVFDLPDHDIIEIDANRLEIIRNINTVGTINFDMVVDPSNGDLLVANFEARNHIAFEPVLKGHCIDTRISRVTTGKSVAKTHHDLNAHIDYTKLPNPEGIATALAEVTGITTSPGGDRIYVAAQGTDRIGVLGRDGAVLARIDVGDVSGAKVDTRSIRGPRNVVHHPTKSRLYVMNRLSHSISVIDTEAGKVLGERTIGHDPTPVAIAEGRRFNYDAKLSGNGTMSCASCHVDGDIDLLCWDLGDPGGKLVPIPPEKQILSEGKTVHHHPMKGPMLTQSLRGLKNMRPLHWRGDREDPQAFNIAFDGLMGGKELPKEDIDAYAHFMDTIDHPPNPNQLLDRSYADPKDAPSAKVGHHEFRNGYVFSHDTGKKERLHCITCHANDTGSNEFMIPPPPFFAVILQPTRIASLRNLYRRQGASRYGKAKVGWGYLHDGRYQDLDILIHTPEFSGVKDDKRDDIIQFLLSFDTGTAPAVGYQIDVDSESAWGRDVKADLGVLESQAAVGNCDLVAKGRINGAPRGLVYDAATDRYLTDRKGDGPFRRADLLLMAAAGEADLVFTGVPWGSGRRIGIDRDEDGKLDGEEHVRTFNATGASSAFSLAPNGESLGSDAFGFVADLEPGETAMLFASFASGVTVPMPMTVDPEGTATFAGGHAVRRALTGECVRLLAVATRLSDGRVRQSNGIEFTLH